MVSSPRYSSKNIDFDNASRCLKILWQDDHCSAFPYVWLRHAQNFPLTGRPDQSDKSAYRDADNPLTLTIKSIGLVDDRIDIHWGHSIQATGHSLRQLRDNCLSTAARAERRPRPKFWQAEEAAEFRWFDATELEQAASRLDLFIHLRDFGIALLRNLPTEPGTLNSIVKYFGPARNTHFGYLFDIRSRPADRSGSGENIGATSSNAQSPHTDEGWRHGPPGISLFHCLKPHPGGAGASIFVDGIAAAESLRSLDPEAFNLLSTVPLLFVAERNDEERFRSRGKVIALDSDGVVRGIRLTDRTIAPVDIALHLVEPVYAALHTFYRLIVEQTRCFERQLEAGEMVIFDNHRVMHARRAFDAAAGERWLQQLSVDREEFHSQFRQLAESLQRDDLSCWETDAGALSQP
ncbi:MAG: gamma-butyrobetaine dioxygenase [Planctomycetota bacterium]|jgi:gamma-butyrobetaine dioxygenase